MIFVKMKIPNQLMYHWCGEGEENCLNVAAPIEAEDEENLNAVIYMPKSALEDQGKYLECHTRGLILDEFESTIEDILGKVDELGFADEKGLVH